MDEHHPYLSKLTSSCQPTFNKRSALPQRNQTRSTLKAFTATQGHGLKLYAYLVITLTQLAGGPTAASHSCHECLCCYALSRILSRCGCLNSLYQLAQPKTLHKGLLSPTPQAVAQPQPQKNSRSEPQQEGIVKSLDSTLAQQTENVLLSTSQGRSKDSHQYQTSFLIPNNSCLKHLCSYTNTYYCAIACPECAPEIHRDQTKLSHLQVHNNFFYQTEFTVS